MKEQTKGMFRGADGRNYVAVFALVASLFFLWGVAHSILDVLNKHFQDALVISKARSALVQAMVYGGYFLMAIPAGQIIHKWGYRTGIVLGLLLYGIGVHSRWAVDVIPILPALPVHHWVWADLLGNLCQSIHHRTRRKAVSGWQA